MPFNSISYYRNAYRRDAIKRLSEAREHKRNGSELWRLESAVKLARCSWRLYLIQCRLGELHGSKPYRPEPFTTKESNND